MNTNTTLIDALNDSFDAIAADLYRKDLIEGCAVLVACWNSKKREVEWLPGTLDQFVSATDRVYRVNVTMDSGVKIDACAPECVITTIPLKTNTIH